MRTWVIVGLLAMAAAVGAFQAPLPRCTSVDPDTSKAGETVTTKGENLKVNVAELYLTDGKKDTKVEISNQSDSEIKFKVPAVPPGRYHLMTLSAKRDSMVEQPVVLTVE